MSNLKFSYETNMWGNILYKSIVNFEEWFTTDHTEAVNYLDWENILKYHVSLGFKGIEVMQSHLVPLKRIFRTYTKFLDFAKDLGIEAIPSFYTSNIGAEDKSKHKAILETRKKELDAIAELGAVYLTIMPVGQYYGLGPLSEDQLKAAADCMNELGRISKDMGIETCVHNQFWCAVNLYDHEKYIALTDPKYVSYCLDTAQVSIMGVDIVKFYDKYHDRVKYFHMKDTTKKAAPDAERFQNGAEFPPDGTRWFWELGAGDVDFVGLWKLLKKYNYKGWVCVETDGTPDPIATMALTRLYIDTVLSPIYA